MGKKISNKSKYTDKKNYTSKHFRLYTQKHTIYEQKQFIQTKKLFAIYPFNNFYILRKNFAIKLWERIQTR